MKPSDQDTLCHVFPGRAHGLAGRYILAQEPTPRAATGPASVAATANIASGNEAGVSGGVGNTAGGSATVVIGGHDVMDDIGGSIRPQPPFVP